MQKSEEQKRTRLKLEDGVHLSLEARRREEEEEHTRIEAEEEASGGGAACTAEG